MSSFEPLQSIGPRMNQISKQPSNILSRQYASRKSNNSERQINKKTLIQNSNYLQSKDEIPAWIQHVYLNPTRFQLQLTSKNNVKMKEQNPSNSEPENKKNFTEKEEKQLQESDQEDNHQSNQILNTQQSQSNYEQFLEYITMINQPLNSPPDKNTNLSILSLQQVKKNQHLIQQNLQKLLENGIKILKEPPKSPNLTISNVVRQAKYQIFCMDISIGPFLKNIKIYNSLATSCFHNTNPFGNGAFSQIYLASYSEQQFVVKCIPRKLNKFHQKQKKKQFEEQIFFGQLFQEYLINYIAGILGIGPKILHPVGFDLIISKDCVQFFVEPCQTPEIKKQTFEESLAQIQEELFNFHLLSFTHNDIKPANIMFNKRLNKLVFIDFGLSGYLLKPIGFQTKTRFMGTYFYCSPEMQRLLHSNSYELVDLYTNDAHCLKNSVKLPNKIRQFTQIQIKSDFNEIHEINMINNFLNQIYLRYLILTKDEQKSAQLGGLMKSENNQSFMKILDFIEKLEFCPYFESFCTRFIKFNTAPPKRNLDQPEQSPFWSQTNSFSNKEQILEKQYKFEFQPLYKFLAKVIGPKKSQRTSTRDTLMLKAQKKLILLSENTSISVEQTWSLYLDFIDFYQYTQTEIQQKAYVSQFLIKKFAIKQKFHTHSKSPIESKLQPIFQCFYYLLNQCFQHPVNSWKRNHFHQILVTLVVMGWKIPKKDIHLWRAFLISNCFQDEESPQNILNLYLRFIKIKQAYKIRYFMFKNDHCIKDIEQKIEKNLEKNDGQSFSLIKFYQQKKEFYERKSQQPKIYELIGDVFETEENPKGKSVDNLLGIISKIKNLTKSDFQDKIICDQLMKSLILWILMMETGLNFQKNRIVDLINYASRFQINRDNNVIDIMNVKAVRSSEALKDNNRNRKQFKYLDKAMNCPFLSEQFLTPHRLVLFIEQKKFKEAQRLINKILWYKMQQKNDSYLHADLTYLLLETFFILDKTQDKLQCRWLLALQEKLVDQINDFMNRVTKNRQLWQNYNTRYHFSYIINSFLSNSRAIRVADQACVNKMFYIFNKIFSGIQNYISILQKMCDIYHEKILIIQLIEAKINFCERTKKFDKLQQYLANEHRVDLSKIDPENLMIDHVLTYINYFCIKIAYFQEQRAYYRGKMIELFYTMYDSKLYQIILEKRSISNQILKKESSPILIADYFESASKFVAENPTRVNVSLLIEDVNKFLMTLDPCLQVLDVRNSFDGPRSFTNLCPQIKFSKEKYDNFKNTFNKFNFDQYLQRVRQNPYICMAIYLIAFELEMERKKMELMTWRMFKQFPCFHKYAKNIILGKYYNRMLKDKTLLKRTKDNIIRKLVRAISGVNSKEQLGFINIFKPPNITGSNVLMRHIEVLNEKHRKEMRNSEILKE